MVLVGSLACSLEKENAQVVQLQLSISGASQSHVFVSHACSFHATKARDGGLYAAVLAVRAVRVIDSSSHESWCQDIKYETHTSILLCPYASESLL